MWITSYVVLLLKVTKQNMSQMYVFLYNKWQIRNHVTKFIMSFFVLYIVKPWMLKWPKWNMSLIYDIIVRFLLLLFFLAVYVCMTSSMRWNNVTNHMISLLYFLIYSYRNNREIYKWQIMKNVPNTIWCYLIVFSLMNYVVCQ